MTAAEVPATAPAPLVSIVIPTRNGASTLPALLQAIRRQHVDFGFEVVAIDSTSTDGTRRLLDGRVDRVLSVEPAEFDHGLTRNLGIEQACGELVVLIVQDAEPADEHWLAALVAPLRADPTVAGSFARQIPRGDAGALTRRYHARWPAASATPRAVSVASPAAFDALTPFEQFDLCIFDNVCSCIRRTVWVSLQFQPSPIAEDLAWARDVLRSGGRLAFAPAALVIHSHERSARYELARTYVLHRRLYQLFGMRTIPSLFALGQSVAASLLTHARTELSIRSLALAFAWPLGQYLGGLSARRGWTLARVRGV